MNTPQKKTYFMNGFWFQYDFLSRHLSEHFYFDLHYPSIEKYIPGWKYIPLNFLLVRKMYKKGEMGKYDIVHFNNTENFLNFKKIPGQLSIAESHGFDFGVNYAGLVKDEKSIWKYILGNCVNLMLGWKIRKKIQEFDIYYCSTPDMLEPLRKYVRADVKWLPNPVNTEIFSPLGDTIKLAGNPACFFPTRLHGDKKPEYAIDIFQKYVKPNFPQATLHLLNQGFELEKYKKLLSDETTYFWHDFMDKQTLAAKIRGSDLCFGDFSIGGLSLMPMQIMACKKPIVSYDMHEVIKVPREDLQELTQKILENTEFREIYVERNYQYIREVHSEKAISQTHLENIKIYRKNKF